MSKHDLVSMMKTEGFLEEGEHQEVLDEIIQNIPEDTKKRLKKFLVSHQLSQLQTKIK
ncbi:MAG: hypothetical protein P1V18_02620 [Candidatus Gracilibacteria bacterium]|nr:hypothetical protein [Candidatus Gracilibacteria bacterium]